MRKFSLAGLYILFFFCYNQSTAYGQSCVPTNLNDTTINLSCGVTCTSIRFQVPHIKSTSTYTVNQVPYAPLPYIVATGGTEDPMLYFDDNYSAAFQLPFPFCFYDSTYRKVVIGSNGLITFDTTNASCDNAYEVSSTIPGAGTDIQCLQFREYYPRAAIMAAYSDLLPTVAASPPGMKIQWRVEGTAPCRKFVVSYFKVGTYPLSNTSCILTPNTFQIILYESTGLIDIYIENKTCYSTSTFGAAILGVQNWQRNAAVAAPGKNATRWTAVNEGYRFTPNSGVSKFISSELLTLNGTFVATADTTTTVAGLLDISFPNICPQPGATQYVVRTTFSGCPTGVSMVSLDTVTLNRNNTLPVSTVLGATTCGNNTGSITINVPAGVGTTPYSFSLNGSTPQATNVFSNLAAGPYMVYATDAAGCDTSYQVNVVASISLSATSTTTAASCPGLNNGSVLVTPTSGTPPYTFSLNNGPSQPTGIFANLPGGSYTIVYTDAELCRGSVTADVSPGTAITSTIASTGTSCAGAADGSITVTPTSGVGPYSFSLDGGAFQAANVFLGVRSGTHTVVVRDAPGCTLSIGVAITEGSVLSSSHTLVNPVCANINDGIIRVLPQAGAAAPFTVTLTGPGGPFTNTGNSAITFSNLAPGTYSYTLSSANGCTGPGATVTLTSNSALLVPATVSMPLCNGNSNGIVTFNPAGGVSPYQYSINAGGTYQASGIFNGLAAGPHTFRIKDNVGCIKDTIITLTQPTTLTSTASGTETAGCSNNDGAIAATATGGTTPYAYTIAGPTLNTTGASTGIFSGLASGSYSVTSTDAKGCSSNATTTVSLVDNMFLEIGADTTICMESSLTFNVKTNTGTSVFAWRTPNAPPGTISNPSVKNATVSPTDTAFYILNAKWGTCVREDTIKVDVLRKPIANAGRDTTICDISYAILRGSATNLSGTVNYSWAPLTGSPAQGVDPTKATTNVYPPGNSRTYVYTLTVTDNYNCKFAVTDQVGVRVQPPVPANAGQDTTAIRGVPHQLNGTGGDDYLWTPSQPLNSSSIPNPLATLQTDTKFVLRVTDFAGCIGYDTVLVKVYEGPAYYIPNAFSPNGDGQNDVFRAIPVGIAKTEWFRVFNRYGELIFQTNEGLKGWDGTYKGQKQPVGAYIWIIKGTDRNGKAIEMKGTVMLIL